MAGVFWLRRCHDRASTRGEMTLRGLYVFSHGDRFGSAPAQSLFDRIKITPVSPGALRLRPRQAGLILLDDAICTGERDWRLPLAATPRRLPPRTAWPTCRPSFPGGIRSLGGHDRLH
jgi:hypothetical protein